MRARRSPSRIASAITSIALIAAGLDAGASTSIRDQSIPDLDQRLGAVLDLDSGELATAPRPASFDNVEEYEAALAEVGDVAYEDAQGGMLFVASGLALPLGIKTPEPTTLQGLDKRLEERTFLRGPELDPGAWFAVRSRTGAVFVGRVVSRSGEAIRLGWSPPQSPATIAHTQWINALEKLSDPRIAKTRLPPLAAAPDKATDTTPLSSPPKKKATVLRLSDGELAVGPLVASPVSPDFLDKLVHDIREAGDLAYFRLRSGMLVIAAGKMARLGTGPLSALQGRDLRGRLKERSIVPSTDLIPGSAILVETINGTYALIRIDSVDPEGLHLSWLLQSDGTAVFNDLAAFDASFQISDPRKLDRLLLSAAARGDSTQVRRLLVMGANANARSDRNARSALLLAVINGHEEVFALLLAAGADLSGAGSDGWNALHVAVKLGRLNMVKALVAAGTDTKARLPGGDDALQIALTASNQDIDLIRFLRKNTKTTDTLTLAARLGDVTAIRSLLAAGADVDQRLDGGQTALEVAAASGQEAAVRALLAVGADPGVESDAGVSALEAAATEGHAETAAVLIEHGGSSEEQITSALYRANQSGSAKVARILLQSGADAEGDAGQKWTPLDYTFQYGSQDLVDVYVAAGYELDVAASARLGRVEELTALLSTGLDPNRSSPDGRSPLQLAIQNGQTESVEVLLSHGVAANEPLATWDRRTPLHEAATRAESETVALLLRWGADTNQVDRVGRTPLYDAISHGREETVRVLLEYGADPNLAPEGEALIDIAGDQSIRELLASHGAQSSKKSRRN